MESGVSPKCVKLLNKGNLGPDFIHLETNREEFLSCLGALCKQMKKFDFRVFLSAFSIFHWPLLESAERKTRKFHAPKCFTFPYNTLSHMVASGSMNSVKLGKWRFS